MLPPMCSTCSQEAIGRAVQPDAGTCLCTSHPACMAADSKPACAPAHAAQNNYHMHVLQPLHTTTPRLAPRSSPPAVQGPLLIWLL
jgi:hypothetical protein